MKPHKVDEAYLWDMREAALEAVAGLVGVSHEQFVADSLRVRAIERLIEIVGEAASHVSRAFQLAHGDIPWAKIIGQRNVLAHDYGDIDCARLFNVVTQHLPTLIEHLDRLNLKNSLHPPIER